MLLSLFLRLFLQEKLMVLRAFTQHLGAALWATLVLTAHAISMWDCFTAFRAHTLSAVTHLMFSMICHKTISIQAKG